MQETELLEKSPVEKLYSEESHAYFDLMLKSAFQKQEKDFPPYPTDFTAELKNALIVEDVLMDAFANPKELYFAYLVDAMHDAGLPMTFDSILPDSQTSKDMDRRVAQKMLKDGLPYQKICDCMAYSPNAANEDPTVRFQLGTVLTVTNINPIYLFEDLSSVRPLQAINPVTAAPEELYNSFLKTVFDRKPELSHLEADEKVIKLMKRNRISKDVADKALATSFVWQKPLQAEHESQTDYYTRLTAHEHLRKEFVFNAWNKDERTESVHHDETLYADMQKSIRDMTANFHQSDVVDYWQKTIDIMDYTLRKFDELELAKKTLKIWMLGVAKAVKDFGMEKDPSAVEALKHLGEINKSFQQKTENFQSVMDTIRKLEHFSQTIMDKADDRRRSNPLLAEIDIQHAQPFEEAANQPDVQRGEPTDEHARALYASAVKAVLKDSFTTDAEETETRAAKYMLDHKILRCTVQKAMQKSSRYKGKPPNEQQKAVADLLERAGGENLVRVGTAKHH